MIDKVTKVAGTLVDALRDQPLVLALVAINLLFIGVGFYVMMKVADRQDARTQLVSEMMRECLRKP